MATSKSENQRASRRRWPLAEKRRIVELTMREGSSIRVIAHEQGVHPTSLSHWKALYRSGKSRPASVARSRLRIERDAAAGNDHAC